LLLSPQLRFCLADANPRAVSDADVFVFAMRGRHLASALINFNRPFQRLGYLHTELMRTEKYHGANNENGQNG